MLKVHIDFNEEIYELEAKGTGLTVISDLTFLIHEIYGQLYCDDFAAGEIFKHLLQTAVEDNNSPVWYLEEKAQEDGIQKIEIRLPDMGE